MSKYPLRGEGLEVRRNTAEDGSDRRKYTLVVDDHLFVELKNSFANMLSDPNRDQPSNRSAWRSEAGSERWTFEYQVSDEDYEAAAADTDCTGIDS